MQGTVTLDSQTKLNSVSDLKKNNNEDLFTASMKPPKFSSFKTERGKGTIVNFDILISHFFSAHPLSGEKH